MLGQRWVSMSALCRHQTSILVDQPLRQSPHSYDRIAIRELTSKPTILNNHTGPLAHIRGPGAGPAAAVLA